MKRNQRGISEAVTTRPINGSTSAGPAPGDRGIVPQPGSAQADNDSAAHAGFEVMRRFGGGPSKPTVDDAKG